MSSLAVAGRGRSLSGERTRVEHTYLWNGGVLDMVVCISGFRFEAGCRYGACLLLPDRFFQVLHTYKAPGHASRLLFRR